MLACVSHNQGSSVRFIAAIHSGNRTASLVGVAYTTHDLRLPLYNLWSQ